MKMNLIPLCCLLLLAGCIKKEKQPEHSPSPPATTGSTTGTPTATTGAHAILSVLSSTFGMNGFNSVVSSARAYFSTLPQMLEETSTAVNAGTVKINNEELEFMQSDGRYHYSGIGDINDAGWSISGGNGFQAFNVSHPGEMPSTSSNLSVFPDTLRRSDGLTFEIKNLDHISNAVFVMVRSDGSSTGLILQQLNTGDNTITVTPAQLKALTSEQVIATLQLENDISTNINSKSVKLSFAKSSGKFITLVD